MPFSGTLYNSQSWAGGIPAYGGQSAQLCSPLVDDANVVYSFAALNGAGDMVLIKWNPATSAVTYSASFGTGFFWAFQSVTGGHGICCWNSDKTGIYVIKFGAVGPPDYLYTHNIYFYRISDGNWSSVGAFVLTDAWLCDCVWDPTLNAYLAVTAGGHGIGTFDFGALTFTLLKGVYVGQGSYNRVVPTSDFIYCADTQSNTGAIARAHRNKEHLLEYLAGARGGQGASVTLPAASYAGVEFPVGGLALNGNDLVIGSNSSNDLFRFDLSTKILSRFDTPGRVFRATWMPNGKLCALVGGQQLNVYS